MKDITEKIIGCAIEGIKI